jgi:peptidoglycan/LPS O-acetylase OafA/YrhL
VHLLAVAAVLPIFSKDLFAGKYGDPIVNLITTAALVQNYFVAPGDRILNGPSWSLSAEFFFYLCFPFLVRGLLCRGIIWRSLIVLFVLTPWFLALLNCMSISSLGVAFAHYHYYYFPPVRIVDFLTGVILGFAWHRNQGFESITRQASIRLATLFEVGAILFLIGWARLMIRHAPGVGESFDVCWEGAYIPPFLICIWVFAKGNGLLSRILSTRPLVYLGELSFGVYMLHMPVMHTICHTPLVREVFDWAVRTMGPPGGTLMVVMETMVLSVACYQLYEMPLRDWIRRKLSIRKAVETVELAGESMNPDGIVRRAA